MSDKEKSLVDQLAKLPPKVQDKFLLMAQGAAVAVECGKREEEEGDTNGTDEAERNP